MCLLFPFFVCFLALLVFRHLVLLVLRIFKCLGLFVPHSFLLGSDLSFIIQVIVQFHIADLLQLIELTLLAWHPDIFNVLTLISEVSDL